MLNEVRIFEASVFNSELVSNFTNSKLDSRNLSQGDSLIWVTPGVSCCSAATGRRSVGDIVSSLLNRRYVDCAADYSAGVASRSCHTGSHIHVEVSIKMFSAYSSFIEAIISLKKRSMWQLSRQQNGNYSAPQNIKVRSAPAACPSVSIGGVHSGDVGGRPLGGVWKDTGGKVTIHVRVPYCVVRPKGTTIRGLYGVYFFHVTASCPKSLQQGVDLTGRNMTGLLCAALGWVTLHMHCVTDDADKRQTPATVTSLALPHYV